MQPIGHLDWSTRDPSHPRRTRGMAAARDRLAAIVGLVSLPSWTIGMARSRPAQAPAPPLEAAMPGPDDATASDREEPRRHSDASGVIRRRTPRRPTPALPSSGASRSRRGLSLLRAESKHASDPVLAARLLLILSQQNSAARIAAKSPTGSYSRGFCIGSRLIRGRSLVTTPATR